MLQDMPKEKVSFLRVAVSSLRGRHGHLSAGVITAWPSVLPDTGATAVSAPARGRAPGVAVFPLALYPDQKGRNLRAIFLEAEQVFLCILTRRVRRDDADAVSS